MAQAVVQTFDRIKFQQGETFADTFDCLGSQRVWNSEDTYSRCPEYYTTLSFFKRNGTLDSDIVEKKQKVNQLEMHDSFAKPGHSWPKSDPESLNIFVRIHCILNCKLKKRRKDERNTCQ